jgi:hypothetical protein
MHQAEMGMIIATSWQDSKPQQQEENKEMDKEEELQVLSSSSTACILVGYLIQKGFWLPSTI